MKEISPDDVADLAQETHELAYKIADTLQENGSDSPAICMPALGIVLIGMAKIVGLSREELFKKLDLTWNMLDQVKELK